MHPLFRSGSLVLQATLAFYICGLLSALGGCSDVRVTNSPLDAGADYDGDVIELAGTWEVRPRLGGDCPHEIVGQPLGGLMRWSQHGSRLTLESLENGDSLNLRATGYNAFSQAEQVSLLGCSAQARLEFVIDDFAPPIAQGRYTATYSRTPGDTCSGDDDLPVTCEQRVDFMALAR